MRLISCTIENFGKLNNVTYDFSEKCNTICEDNGWGKSTLASFVRVMFYGFKNESKKKLVDKERNRLMPWQKGVFGGEVVFEANGIMYSLRRVFGRKPTDDEFLLVRKDTNKECNDFSSNIGEELFKIDAQSFERTVFIGQSDCVTETTDSINAKIGNLADNTDDINNFETAVGRLAAELNNISGTRATGSINKRATKLTQLQAQINNYSEIDKTIDEQTKIRDGLCGKSDELKENKAQLQSLHKNLSAKKDVRAIQEKYNLLKNECNIKKNNFERLKEYFNGDIPDKEEVKNIINLNDEAGRISGRITSMKADGQERYDKLRDVFEDGVPADDEIGEWLDMVHRLDELKREAAKNSLSDEEQARLEAYKNRFNKGVPDKNRLSRIHDIWVSAQNKQSALIAKEIRLDTTKANDAAAFEREQHYKNQYVTGIIAGAIIAVAGGVLAALTGVIGIIILIAGLCMTGIFAGMASSNKKQHESRLQNIKDESDRRIKAIEDEINEDRNFINGTENIVKQFCSEYEITFDKDNVTWILSELRHDIEDYAYLEERAAEQNNKELYEDIHRTDSRIKDYLSQFRYISCDDNYELAIERIRNDAHEYSRITEELAEQKAYREQYQKHNEEIIRFLKTYIKAYDNKESIGDLLRMLDKNLDEYYRAKSEYDNAISVKKDFEADNDVRMFEDETDETDRHSLEQLAEDMQIIDKQIDEYMEQIQQCNKQLESLQIQADECEKCRTELEELQAVQDEEKDRERILKLTKQIMEDSKQAFTSKYMEPVMEGFTKYFTIITGHEPDTYRLDADTKLTVMEQNLPRDIGYMSAGKQDLIGVCMRMALVEAMYKDEKPFLVFDDPFVNLDDTNIKGAMRLLDEIAKNYQVIYFTCSESRIHN